MNQTKRTLFQNAHFYRGADIPPASSVLVESGSIVALDPSNEELAGAEAKDLSGAWVYPAFEDAHTHPAGRARTFAELDFRNMQITWAEAKERIAERIRSQAPGTWVVCHGWDSNVWDINRNELDELSKEHGIFIINISYHGGVINTYAETLLHAKNISPEHAEGFVTEREYQKVFIATSPSVESYLDTIPRYQEKLRALGITAAHDMHITSFDQLEAYKRLDEKDGLLMHTLTYINPQLLENKDLLSKYISYKGTSFEVRGIKLFADGAIGMYTAALSTPYTNKPQESGTLLLTKEEYIAYAHATVNAGLSEIAVHCIGDEAVRVAVDACIEAKKLFPSLQWRFEHFEMTDDAVLDKVQESGAIVCLQPNFSWDIPHYENRLGNRVEQINQLQKIASRNIPYMFGSDDMPTGPVAGIVWATSQAPSTAHALPLEAAFRAYTGAPAQLTGRGNTWGRIEKGYGANFVLFENDFFKNPTKENKILGTFFWGK